MAFSWQRLRKRPARAGVFADAPVQNVALPFTLAPHDWNSLWGAAALGHSRIVARLLKKGARPDERDESGKTALHYAVEARRREIVELLLARGASPDTRDDTGCAPLHLAVLGRDRKTTGLLLARGARPDIGESDGPTPLMEAIRRGDASLALMLLRAGASVAATDRFGHTPIFYVNAHSAASMLGLLFAFGAERLARASDGDTALHRALRIGDEALWRALAPADDEPILLHLPGRFDDLALHAAAEGGNASLIRRLLHLGADPNARNRFGHSALLIALHHEDLPAATLLRERGARVGFLEAVALGDGVRAAEEHALSGVEISAPISGTETPLMGAVARGREDLVRLLLQRGAHPHVATAALGSALDVAVLTGQGRLARLLVEKGADPARVYKASPAEVRAALKEEESDALPAGETVARRPDAAAIYAAATAATDDDLRWLRLLGAEVNQTDEAGLTALLAAVRDGDVPAVRRLLAFGADPQGAADLARAYHRTEILSLLEGDQSAPGRG